MTKARLTRRMSLGVVAIALGALACDSGEVVQPPPPDPEVTPTKASDWVDYVNWDQSQVVEVEMVEGATSLTFSPNQLTFEAGKPYVLRLVNAGNELKHYFSPDGFESFYQAIATRKVQTADAEYKAPYFDAVELKIGGALEVFFVPVLAGTYDIVCTIPGHEEAGMTATVTITGGEGYQLDLEVAPDFDQSLTSDARKSGGHEVWASAIDETVGMLESGSTLGYTPPEIELTADVGYKLRLENSVSNGSKHYYTAEQFYKSVVWRKADDGEAEIKAPYLRAVELLIGGSTTLFIVPTDTGSFDVICTIPGHVAAGMTGTIQISN